MASRWPQDLGRARPSDLSPLVTDQAQFLQPVDASHYRDVVSASPGSTNSLMGLATPSITAVRQFDKHYDLKTALQAPHVPANYQAHETDLSQLPRRHSSLMSSVLINGMNNVRVSSPSLVTKVQNTKERLSIVDHSRDILLEGVQISELAGLGGVVSHKKPIPGPEGKPSQAGRTLPDHTGGQLREWGGAYLGNTVMADAFVKAIQLRVPGKPPKNQLGPREGTIPNGAKNWEFNRPPRITVRARVFPKAKERKPFLIQRQFNLEEMRASLPQPRAIETMLRQPTKIMDDRGLAEEQMVQHSRTRSQSDPATQVAEMAANLTSQESHSPARRPGPVGRRVVPIHVEYALNYLPVLAALMVSGHIRKGDAIELPLPHPSAWAEVISYIYTGEGDVTLAMKENILYLAGRVSDD